MALVSTNEIAAPVNIVYQRTLLDSVKAVTPHFVGSEAGRISSDSSGSFTVNWRRYENLTPVTAALSEVTGSLAFPVRTGVQPSITNITATVQKFGNVIFLNEEVDLGSFNEVTDKLVEVLGINAGRSLNALQRNELEDNSTVQFAGTATVVGNIDVVLATTGGDIDQVVNLLDRASARRVLPMTTGSVNVGSTPIRSSFIGICHPDVEMDVRQMVGFAAAETYAGQTQLFANEFGAANGVRWVSTPEASIDADSGGASLNNNARFTTASTAVDVYNNVIMGEGHHGSVTLDMPDHPKEIYTAGDELPSVMMISHAAGSAGSADPLNEVSSVGWKSWHAAAVLTNSNTPTEGEHGFCLRSGARVL